MNKLFSISILFLLSMLTISNGGKADASPDMAGEKFIKTLDELRLKVDKSQRFESQDYRKLDALLEYFCGPSLNNIPINERQSEIKNGLGADAYSTFELVLINQLDSGDKQLRFTAIRSLGELYSFSAEAKLKNAVFCDDSVSQFAALVSLVRLGTPGSGKLLLNIVLAGTLPEEMVRDAVDAMASTQNQELSKLVPVLIEMYQHNHSIMKALLPSVSTRSDKHEIIINLFLANDIKLAEGGNLSLQQMTSLNLYNSLLDEMIRDYEYYENVDALMRQFDEYASSQITAVYVPVFRFFETSGKSLDYYVSMLKQDDITPEKRRFLEMLIERIDR